MTVQTRSGLEKLDFLVYEKSVLLKASLQLVLLVTGVCLIVYLAIYQMK